VAKSVSYLSSKISIDVSKDGDLGSCDCWIRRVSCFMVSSNDPCFECSRDIVLYRHILLILWVFNGPGELEREKFRVFSDYVSRILGLVIKIVETV
jgi:hypothetical protein